MNLKYQFEDVSEIISERRSILLEEYMNSEIFISDIKRVEHSLDVAMLDGNRSFLVKEISKPDLMADFLKYRGFYASPWGENCVSIIIL